jgi:hypothetical protein
MKFLFSTNIENLVKATSIETNSKVLVEGEVLLQGRLTTTCKKPMIKIPILRCKLNPRN